MDDRRRFFRVRVICIVVGIVLGGGTALLEFPALGWRSLLIIPLAIGILFGLAKRIEWSDRSNQKTITVHLDLHPEEEEPPRGAA